MATEATANRRFGLWIAALLAALIAFTPACDDNGDNDEASSPGDTTEGSDAAGDDGAPPRQAGGAAFTAAEIAEMAVPSVVRIGIECGGPAATQCAGVGSGWVYDGDGHIVTNNHVIAPPQQFGGAGAASSILVNTDDGRVFEAELVGRDPRTDLALLRVDGADLEPLELTGAGDIVIGEPVVAVGYALDLGNSPSITTGVVSALERAIQEQTGSILGALQTDAAINPGNSGGPLLDLDGAVVGVNTAGIQGAEGIGFAIGAPTVRAVIGELLETGEVSRAFLGVTIRELSPALAGDLGIDIDTGVLIDSVMPGSPADEAGLRQGDVITEVGGTEITRASDLQIALIGHEAGDTIPLQRHRDGDQEEVDVTVAEPPA